MHLLDRFHWKNKTQDIRDYFSWCSTCQQHKDNISKPLGHPQPIPLPERLSGSVSMDFIAHPAVTARGFNAITTVVDRFSRPVHLIAFKYSDTTADTVNTFCQEIFRLHGMPNSIISDRDPKFRSAFWKSLMALCDVKLLISTSNTLRPMFHRK